MRITMSDRVESLLHNIAEYVPWLSTLLLSIFASFAQYADRVRSKSKKWVWREFFLDAIVCVFVGVVTHLLCEWQGVDGTARSVLVAVSAHMGTRAMMQYQKLRDRILGVTEQ